MVAVLVACEFTGCVRDAFIARGHDAISCDVAPSEAPGPHIVADLRDLRPVIPDFDLVIAFPPCTYLASSGARWWKGREAEQQQALAFVRFIRDLPCPRIAIENPRGRISTAIARPDQVIAPWQFGHAETKATCLWLKGLWPLLPTQIVTPDFMRRPDGSYYRDKKGKRYSRIHFMSGRKDPAVRRRERSRTYPGIARAMAAQWGDWTAGQIAPLERMVGYAPSAD